MRKVKLDGKKAENLHEDKMVTILGKEVTVRNHIPYNDKLALAEELVNITAITDDEEIVVMESHSRTAVEALMVLKYYTNVDTETLSPADAHNIMMNTGEWEPMYEFCEDDFAESLYIADKMMSNIQELFDRQKSLSHAIKTSFGFLFNGEDITDTLADSLGLNEELVGIFEKLREANKTTQSKLDDGKINVGGNIIDITPKE